MIKSNLVGEICMALATLNIYIFNLIALLYQLLDFGPGFVANINFNGKDN
jgi:hypothetical protein